tara:strand:+ start:1203 stop:1430 length:228 start_codon:yes stop_codon:yes gene_type:complete
MMIRVTKHSPLSGLRNTLEVDCTIVEYALWKSTKMLIQECLPNVSVDEREFLISGIYPGEWEELATVRGAVHDPD